MRSGGAPAKSMSSWLLVQPARTNNSFVNLLHDYRLIAPPRLTVPSRLVAFKDHQVHMHVRADE